MAAAPASFWMFLVNTGIWPSLEKKSPRPASFNLTTLGSNVTCSGGEAASVAFSMMRDTVTVRCGVVSTCGGRKRTTALPAGLGASGDGAGAAAAGAAGGAVNGGAVAGGVSPGAPVGGAVAGGRVGLTVAGGKVGFTAA